MTVRPGGSKPKPESANPPGGRPLPHKPLQPDFPPEDEDSGSDSDKE